MLLDPENILIVAGAADTGANDGELADGAILFTDSPGATFTISQGTLQGQLGAVTLQATDNITINPGVSLNFAGTGNITFTADANNDGVGSFSMDAGDSITTTGRNITISGASINAGTINTSATGAGYFATATAGSVTLLTNTNPESTGRNISFVSINTTATATGTGYGGTATAQGGNVQIIANGLVQGTGVNATGSTIDTRGVATVAGGGAVQAQAGTVEITHDGGPDNVPFTVGSATTNGTAGAINNTNAATPTLASGTFPVLPTGGTTTDTP